MNIPVEARSRIELGIYAREEPGGDVGGDGGADEVVREGGEEDFVNVER